MKTIRLGLSVLVIAILGLGYALSQVAVLNGTATLWAQKVDQPPVVAVSLLLVMLAIILALVREQTEEP